MPKSIDLAGIRELLERTDLVGFSAIEISQDGPEAADGAQVGKVRQGRAKSGKAKPGKQPGNPPSVVGKSV